MRQLLLSGMMLATAFTLSAAIERPVSFVSDFSDYQVPAGWLMKGNGGQLAGDFAGYFPDYSATNSFEVLSASGIDATAFSPSQFADDSVSDEWLITPEFTVTKASELLCFTVVTTGNSVKNNYAVYLSEGGTEKEDFDTQLMKTALQGGNAGINTATRRVVLEGYEGKTVRLAFVNLGNMSGILGFNGVSVAPYYLNIENPESLENAVLDGGNPTLSFRMKVATPVKVAGLTATLRLDNGSEYTYSYTGNITSGMFTTVSPEFEGIDFGGKSQCDYTVTISLNDESMAPTTVTGTIINAERIYAPTIVAEEFTGTWCGYCPLGQAYLAYYSDYYDGTRADGARFFMAAVHDGDPMQAPTAYMGPAMTLAQKYGFNGYPSAMLNRREVVHPAQIDIDAVMGAKSYGAIAIRRADYDENTGEMKINYAPRISFTSPGIGLSVSAIIVENDLSGTNSQWSQTNNFSKFTSQDIAEQLGEEMVPYMAQFVDRGTQAAVPYTEMVYNEVVRDAMPSFSGQGLEGEWTADTDREETMEFKMPLTVSDPTRSAIILVLTNTATGEIIAADKVEAEDYGKDLSGVEKVMATDNGLRMYADHGVAVIESQQVGYVEIYGADGRLNAREALRQGRNEIQLPAGLSILNAVTPAGKATLKTVK